MSNLTQEVNAIVINIDDIIIEDRGRQEFGNIVSLALSIQTNSLLFPPIVNKEGNKYRLIDGERRIRAYKHLGYTQIPVLLRENLTPIQIMEMEVTGNVDRLQMTDFEIIERRKKIHDFKMKSLGVTSGEHPKAWSQDKSALMLNISPATLSADLQLAELFEKVPQVKEICKNRTEALKLIKNFEKKVTRDEALQKVASDNQNVPMDLRKDELAKSYIVENTLIALPKVEPKIAKLVHIDPPYAINLDTKSKRTDVTNATEGRNYNEWTIEEYVEYMQIVLKESYRILEDNGWLILWFDIKKLDLNVNLLEEAGFDTGVKRNTHLPAIWAKTNTPGMTHAPEMYLGSAYETFLYARKGEAKLNKPGRSNVYNYEKLHNSKRTHIAQKPINLLIDVFSTFVMEGSFIVDPFLGSGVSILAANNYSCKCIGYDLSSENKKNFLYKVFQQEPGNFNDN